MSEEKLISNIQNIIKSASEEIVLNSLSDMKITDVNAIEDSAVIYDDLCNSNQLLKLTFFDGRILYYNHKCKLVARSHIVSYYLQI